ncbi:hypothetical protein NDU88_002084 [Pleurodeles waltl]|uniref:Uncharacterized protein n=1 Tax=Pleurodeles waltl TaxID=8319 RepID=A0AAV7TJR2_PLEWA|nr:hypothetical protein NDU88_002084 [Pleurodeles waltl]
MAGDGQMEMGFGKGLYVPIKKVQRQEHWSSGACKVWKLVAAKYKFHLHFIRPPQESKPHNGTKGPAKRPHSCPPCHALARFRCSSEAIDWPRQGGPSPPPRKMEQRGLNHWPEPPASVEFTQ